MEVYHSPYEAYPFLCDDAEDLRCDFELFTDEMASRVGLLRAQTAALPLREELTWICTLLYHLNPTLRTHLTVTNEECAHLLRLTEEKRTLYGARCPVFVLPQGCEAACNAHILRVQAKSLARLLYRHAQQGHTVPPLLFDIVHLLSGYFFFLALAYNAQAAETELSFESRNYPSAGL